MPIWKPAFWILWRLRLKGKFILLGGLGLISMVAVWLTTVQVRPLWGLAAGISSAMVFIYFGLALHRSIADEMQRLLHTMARHPRVMAPWGSRTPTQSPSRWFIRSLRLQATGAGTRT